MGPKIKQTNKKGLNLGWGAVVGERFDWGEREAKEDVSNSDRNSAYTYVKLSKSGTPPGQPARADPVAGGAKKPALGA